MAEVQTIDPGDHSRDELDQLALDAGLTGAKRYANKPAVADAINRVRAGEDATAVTAELADNTAPQGNTPSPNAEDHEVNSGAAKRPRSKKIHAVNGGHPVKFDETGNPVYDPEQV